MPTKLLFAHGFLDLPTALQSHSWLVAGSIITLMELHAHPPPCCPRIQQAFFSITIAINTQYSNSINSWNI